MEVSILNNKFFYKLILLFFSVFALHGQINNVSGKNLKELKDYFNYTNTNKTENNTYTPSPSKLDTLFTVSYKDSLISESDLEYFGYSFFSQREFIELTNDINPSSDYILGPGDLLILSLWGDVQIRKSYIVDNRGSIFIDSIGLLEVAGKSVYDTESILFDKFRTVYSTLSGDSPSTFFSLSVDMMKNIKVIISGEVDTPGVYAIHSSSNLTTALIKAGGVKNTGTLRSIQLIRDNKLVSELDLYSLILYGKTVDDISLKNNDVIHIPIRENSVKVRGDVVREGIYEFKVNANLDDLIMFSGGINPSTSKIIELKRILPMSDRQTSDNSYINSYLSIDNRDLKLIDGDEYKFFKVPNSINKVTIFGQVKNPGEYTFEESMTLMDLLELSGGIHDLSYRKSMSLNNAEIIRRTIDSEYPLNINVNLTDLIDNKNKNNIELQNLDFILVRNNPNFVVPEKIEVAGEVNSPGFYTIQSQGESVDNIIVRAGGFTEKAFKDGVRLYRSGKQVVLYDYSINVMDGDSLSIPQYPGVVNVIGDVYNQGLIQYDEGKGVKHYIRRSGGFTPIADKKNIVIIYPNGDVKLYTSLIKPKVKEGSTIIINSKIYSEPFDVTKFVKEIASISASLATIFLIISQIQPDI